MNWGQVAVVCVVLIVGLIGWLVLRSIGASNERRAAELKAEEAAEHERRAAEVIAGFEAGTCDRDGNPLCEKCPRVASLPRPYIGLSKREQRPSVQRDNRLHARPPKYSVEVDEHDPKLCPRCRRIADEFLEYQIAGVRAKQAAFNAQIEASLAVTNTRGLDGHFEQTARALQGDVQVPQLTGDTADGEPRAVTMAASFTLEADG